MKKTKSTIKVLAELCERPLEHRWGYELSRLTGVRSGVLYPMLQRLLDAGMLEDGWESPAAIQGRPPRRYYKLTPGGHEHAQQVLREAALDKRFAPLLGGMAT